MFFYSVDSMTRTNFQSQSSEPKTESTLGSVEKLVEQVSLFLRTCCCCCNVVLFYLLHVCLNVTVISINLRV